MSLTTCLYCNAPPPVSFVLPRGVAVTANAFRMRFPHATHPAQTATRLSLASVGPSLELCTQLGLSRIRVIRMTRSNDCSSMRGADPDTTDPEGEGPPVMLSVNNNNPEVGLIQRLCSPVSLLV